MAARPPQTSGSVWPNGPAVGAIAGSIWAGIPNSSSRTGSQAPEARLNSIVRAAMDGSVMWTAPPDSCQISQQFTSPNNSAPRAAAARAPGISASSQRSFDALKAGSSGRPVRARMSASQPSPRNSRHASDVLVSRQLIAG